MLDPARIKEIICRNNVSEYTDYCFAVIQRLQNMDVPKGMYHMLKLIDNLLEKFAEEGNLSEIQQHIIRHGDILEYFKDFDDDPKYKKVQQISSEIYHKYVEDNSQPSN